MAKRNKRPFVGGAEQARRDARKKRNRPNNENRKLVHATDRFWFGLCGETALAEYLSNDSRNNCCHQRANIGEPQRLAAKYESADEFYLSRASLVLEDARHVLAQALKQRRKSSEIPVKLIGMKARPKKGFTLLTFVRRADDTSNDKSNFIQQRYCWTRKRDADDAGEFTPRERFDMRPGSCFCVTCNGAEARSSWSQQDKPVRLLASVAPLMPQHAYTDTLTLTVYCNPEDLPDTKRCLIAPVVSLISHLRQFEACVKPPRVAFLDQLLGRKASIHTRFDDDDDDQKSVSSNASSTMGNAADTRQAKTGLEAPADAEHPPEEQHGDDKEAKMLPMMGGQIGRSGFQLPTLNATQERAMRAFLDSPPSTLTLVQGPPGSGKTTWMVSVLANLLIETTDPQQRRRILVTAPTNKAVTILATRFLNAIVGSGSDGHPFPYRVVLIGVEDKLVEEDSQAAAAESRRQDDTFSISGSPAGLRRVFVYTFVEELIKDYKSLQKDLQQQQTSEHRYLLCARARELQHRLLHSLPSQANESGAARHATFVAQHLEECQGADFVCAAVNAIHACTEALSYLDSLETTNELLHTAHVIFCTLSAAGLKAVKKIKEGVTDLLVDEAAAATEAEICIPFRLKPSRLLAVGDPRQLPALVTSRFALDLGLGKSLHERLMDDCGAEHIMLDTQYRMKPAISQFPSQRFYNAGLKDGPNVLAPGYQANMIIRDGATYEFLQVNGEEHQGSSGSYSNMAEAKCIVKLVQLLLRSGLKQKTSDSRYWCDPDRLRIITFYQGQVLLIRQMLGRAGFGSSGRFPLVATVDSSQGCETDIVLVSFVRSNKRDIDCRYQEQSARKATGFLTDDKRLNVALTRARHQLICVGDARVTLQQHGSETMRALVQDAEKRSCLRDSGF